MALHKLSEITGVRVAADSTDVRGWRARTEDGAEVGVVSDLLVDDEAELVRQVVVRTADDRQVLWPVARLRFSDARREVVLAGLPADELTLPRRLELREDRLRVDKRRVRLGEVSVSRRPVEETVEEDVTLWSDEVSVERHLVERPASGDERPIVEGDVIRVPVLAERLVVEKRPYVVEEIVLTRHRRPREQKVRERLRHEEVTVEEHREGPGED